MSKHDCPPEREPFDSIHLTPIQRQRIAAKGCQGTFIRLGTGWVCDCDVCVRADLEFPEADVVDALASLDRQITTEWFQ